MVLLAEAAHRRFRRTVAVLEADVVGRAVGILRRAAAEGADVAASRGGNRAEREAARDLVQAARRGGRGRNAQRGAADEPALLPVVDRGGGRRVDRVAVLDDGVVADRVREAGAERLAGERHQRADAAANRRARRDRARESGPEAAGREAHDRAVLGGRALAESAEPVVERAGRAAAAEDVGAAVLAEVVGVFGEAVVRPRAGDGAVLEEGALRVGVAVGARGIAGVADETGAVRRDAAHGAAAEGAVPRGRAEAGVVGGHVLRRAAEEGVGADGVGDARDVLHDGLLAREEAGVDRGAAAERLGGAVDELRAGGGDDAGEAARGVADGEAVRGVGRAHVAVGEDLRAVRPADEAAEEATAGLDRALEGAVVAGGVVPRDADRSAAGGEGVVVVVGGGVFPADAGARGAAAQRDAPGGAHEAAAALGRIFRGDGVDLAVEGAVREGRAADEAAEAADVCGAIDAARHGAVRRLDAEAGGDEPAGTLAPVHGGSDGAVRHPQVDGADGRGVEAALLGDVGDEAGGGEARVSGLGVRDGTDEVAVQHREAGGRVGGGAGLDVFGERRRAAVLGERGGAPAVPERREADVADERDVLHDRAVAGVAEERAGGIT